MRKPNLALFLSCFLSIIAGSALCAPATADLSSKALVTEALKAADRISGDDQENALAMIAAAQAKSGDIAGAQHTLQRITAGGPKGMAAYAIAGAEATAGDVASAMATANAMPDKADSNYEAIVEALAKKGDIAGAQAAAAHVGGGFLKAHAVAAIAVAQATAGDLATAEANAATIIGAPDVKATAYADIAGALAKAGNPTGARRAIELANGAAAEAADYLLPLALAAVAQAQVQVGDNDAAMKTALRVKDAESAAMIYENIAIAQAEVGNVAAAQATATKLSEPYSKAYALSCIAEAQAKAHDASGVRQTLAVAKTTAAQVAEIPLRAGAFARIAEAQTKSGDAAGAVEWAHEQKYPQIEVEILAAVAEALPK